MEKERRLISVIIPTYNRCEILEKCIDSVLRSTYKNLEVIVVDNCSTDNTSQMLTYKQKEDRRLRVLHLDKNLMAAGGRNQGIKISRGDYLLFLDNDNIVETTMIENLYHVVSTQSGVGLVGPISVNENIGGTIWMASGDYDFYTSKPKQLLAGKKYEEVVLEGLYETYYSPNAMMIPRDVINIIGGFDVSYYAMYEEADIGYRIRMLGYKAYIVADAITHHMNYVSDGEDKILRIKGIGSPERAYHFAKNRFVFEKKYANILQRIIFFLFFSHIYTIYYCTLAIIHCRYDIAFAYCKGTLNGRYKNIRRVIKVDIE